MATASGPALGNRARLLELDHLFGREPPIGQGGSRVLTRGRWWAGDDGGRSAEAGLVSAEICWKPPSLVPSADLGRASIRSTPRQQKLRRD